MQIKPSNINSHVIFLAQKSQTTNPSLALPDTVKTLP